MGATGPHHRGARHPGARLGARRRRGRLADEPPLLLCNGIGASLEALQPLVDALDPDRGVVRFDVPGVGGSAAAAAALPDRGAVVVGDRADGAGSATGGSTCSGCPGVAASPSSSRCSRGGAYAAWCWSPPAPAALMVPAHPRVLAKMMTPRRHRDPEYAASIAAEIYGGSMRTDPERGADAAARDHPRRARSAATTTSWPR